MQILAITLLLGALFYKYPLISLILTFVFIFYFRRKKEVKLVIITYVSVIFFIIISQICFFNEIKQVMLVVETKKNYILVSNLIKKYYLPIKNNTYEVGDLLFVDGTIDKIQMHAIESHVDFQNYLNNKGVFYEIDLNEISTIFNNPWRKREVIKWYLNKLTPETKDLVSSLVFGNSRSKTLTNYNNSLFNLYLSLNHLFVSSLFYFVYAFIKKKTNKKPLIKAITIFLPYFLLIYDKVVFYRLIIEVLVFNKGKEMNISRVNCVFLLMIIYLINPFNLYQLSIFYSLAIYGFFLLINLIKVKKIKKLFLLYVFINILSIALFQKINVFSVIVRTLCSPIMFLFFVASLLFSFAFPLLINNYGIVIYQILNFTNDIDLNIYLLNVKPLIALIIVVCLLYLYSYFINYKKMKRISTGIMLFLITLISSPINNYVYDYLYFIDVGQGDCALLVHKNKTLLIDTGGLTYEDLAKTTLIPFFKKHHINKIDTVICSHSDFDHIGALDSLNKNMEVRKIIKDKNEFPYNFYGININNLNNYNAKNENDSSLINTFNFLGKNFLFLGDASKTIEKKIVRDYDLSSIDIIKIGHHGSNTSTSEELISVTRPSEAIISLGFNNFYGFPNEEVINTLNKYNVKIRRTDESGTIIYKKLLI